MKSNFINR